jgi:hypothetical protein
MNRRNDLHSNRRTRALVLALFAVAVGLAACDEKLEGGAACPLLCPTPAAQLKDTLIDAVAIDSSLAGFPRIGEESQLLLAARGDTLETRVIFRFDTLSQTYTHTATPADSVITSVDSARLQVVLDTTTLPGTPGKPTAPVTVELYDVDAATDTVAGQLLPLFTSSRLLGSRTFEPESLKDTLRLPVGNDVVLDRIVRGARLRIGLRLVSPTSTQLRFLPSAAQLRFKPAADTTLSVSLISLTPTDSTLVAFKNSLADFVILAKGLPPLPPNTIGAGGFPARRTYMRFDLPPTIVDSSTVVRASLILTQFPRRNSPGATDSIAVYPVPITAGTALTDVNRLITFATGVGGTDSLRLVPADTGTRRLELVNLVRLWRNTKPEQTQRAVVLRLASEGLNPAEVVFFSSKAGTLLRPRLQLTYVPRVNFGLP